MFLKFFIRDPSHAVFEPGFDLYDCNPFFSPVTSAVCPSPSLRMPTRSSSLGNLRENQLDEYEGMDCATRRIL